MGGNLKPSSFQQTKKIKKIGPSEVKLRAGKLW